MGKESQIIEFVLTGSHKNLLSSLGKAEKGMDDLAEKTESLFLKGFAKSGKGVLMGVTALTKLVEKAIVPFAEHVETMEKYRKEAGLTQGEIADFSAEVISSSTKYGVALSRVASMAAFVGKGLGKGREKAVQLSAAMANLNDATGATDETTGRLSSVLFRLFNVEAEKTENLMYGIAEVARESHVPLEDINAALADNKDALRALPIGRSIKEFSSFVATMIEAKAGTEQYYEVLQNLGNVESNTRKKFDAIVDAGGGMKEFMQDLTKQVEVFRGQLDAGTISQASYERSLYKLGENFGLHRFTMEKMADSYGNMSSRMQTFDEIQAKSVEENRKNTDARLSALARLGKKTETWTAAIAGYFEELWGPRAGVWGHLHTLMDGIEKIFVAADQANYLIKLSADTADSLLGISDAYTGDENITPFLSKNKGERYIHEKTLISSQANKLSAMGLTTEAARFRSEQMEALNRKFNVPATIQEATQSVPASSVFDSAAGDAAAMVGPLNEIAAHTRAMKASNEALARQARMDSIANQGSGGGRSTRATSLSKGLK